MCGGSRWETGKATTPLCLGPLAPAMYPGGLGSGFLQGRSHAVVINEQTGM